MNHNPAKIAYSDPESGLEGDPVMSGSTEATFPPGWVLTRSSL